MTSEITVIVPSFNKKPYISECIKSVINQTYKNWNLIILDDCSNDGTQEFLNQLETNKKVEVILLKKNKGPSFCRNLGLRLTKSKYVAFLDADDFWDSNKLEDQINFMKKENFDFTYTDYYSIRDNILIKKTNLPSKLNYREFIKNSSINTCTMIIRRALIGTLKFKKLELLEDYIFKCEILKKNITANKFNFCDTAYRLTDDNRSSNKIKNLLFLWKLNKKFNNLNFFENLISVLSVSLNSLKKYGLQKYK